MFAPPNKEKMPAQIMQQIRDAVMQGKLKPGQALPQEKDLVAEFGVSKHTLREALRSLETLGFITIRRGAGGGPVVSEIDWGTARDYFSSFLHFQKFTLADLSEARKLVEPYIARKAAEQMTQENLEELRAAHKECVTAFLADKDIIRNETEVRFHVLLGKSAANPFLWVMLDFVNNMLADAKHKLKPGKDFSVKVIEAHQRILDAIERRDPELAAQAMFEHICEVEEGLNLLDK
ncbi:MAG: FadR family transcriptional regulator [Desulfovibrionaceae bacterium]|nr:FadR family transcriptional regulator [Desulfovibrionaceae bacterium]